MNKAKQKYQNSISDKNKKSGETSLEGAGGTRDEETDIDSTEKIFHQHPDIFLLNNLLMSVQFFENYERDVCQLRKDWFKDTALPAYHKTCFHADSLFRLSAENVKYSPRHGPHKNSETSLHPLRIYISSDNIEASFDPSADQRGQNGSYPQYRFTVKNTEGNTKSGCVQLIENRMWSCESPKAFPRSDFPAPRESLVPSQQSYTQWQRRSHSEVKNTRRLTKTEKFIGSLNNPRRGSLKLLECTTDGVVSVGDFYKFAKPEGRVKPVSIQEFRMNCAQLTACEIPLLCFQRQHVKQPLNASRRAGILKSGLRSVFKSQHVLNASAFKGYFCDLLVERLAGALRLDSAAVNGGSVLGEFVLVNQSGMQYGIAPVIPIRDWSNFIVINERLKSGENRKQLPWPSRSMQKIVNILPCGAVPVGHSEENPDYESEWMLIFPKTEEFLLLHMMHAHVRCYFFALLIYKSFVESEINAGSFGPKHFLHLLFWRVHKNFLAWPEDRPGETLLIFLKAMYKKIQNKYLSDFFVNSRNLFATSLPNDLHKAQAIIKKVIENPIPCVIRALRNLQLNSNFYPPLDLLQLNNVLTAPKTPYKPRKIKKEKKQRVVRFEDADDEDVDNDDERQWKKNAIKQIELERKFDNDDTPKLSVESVNTEEALNFDTGNRTKRIRVLEIFFSHFLNMRRKSLEFKFSPQALSYLSHAQKLLDLMASEGGSQNGIKALQAKLNKLTGNGFTLKHDWPQSMHEGQPPQVPTPLYASQDKVQRSESEENEVDENIKTENKENEAEWQNPNGDASDEEEIFESKL